MKYTLATILTAILATTSAQDTCPNGSSSNTIGDKSYCCPHGLTIAGDSQAYCVIGCTITSTGGGYSPCFPTCSDPSENSMTPLSFSTSGSCTSVPVTATNYSQLVYGSASGISASTTASSSATSTSAPSAATTSAGQSTATASTAVSVSGAAGTTITPTPTVPATTSSSSSKAGGAVVTAAPVMVLGAVAGMMLL